MIELNYLRQLLLNALLSEPAALPNYQQMASQLRLLPPNSIGQLTTALEQIMREDALAERPQLAATCVQKRQPYPREGFFQLLSALNLYQGPDSGNQAEMWHIREMERLQRHYSAQQPTAQLSSDD